METWLKWIHAIGSCIHWLTGWMVHPDRGGCCEQDKIKNDLENKIKGE